MKQAMRDKRIEHRAYIEQHGDDMPEIHDWTWPIDSPKDRSTSNA